MAILATTILYALRRVQRHAAHSPAAAQRAMRSLGARFSSRLFGALATLWSALERLYVSRSLSNT